MEKIDDRICDVIVKEKKIYFVCRTMVIVQAGPMTKKVLVVKNWTKTMKYKIWMWALRLENILRVPGGAKFLCNVDVVIIKLYKSFFELP